MDARVQHREIVILNPREPTIERRVFDALCAQPRSLRELAAELHLSLPSVKRAIAVLRKTGRIASLDQPPQRYGVQPDARPPTDGRGRIKRRRRGVASND